MAAGALHQQTPEKRCCLPILVTQHACTSITVLKVTLCIFDLTSVLSRFKQTVSCIADCMHAVYNGAFSI